MRAFRCLLLASTVIAHTLPAQSHGLRGFVTVVSGEERITYSGERNAPLRWTRIFSAPRFDSMTIARGRSVLHRTESNSRFTIELQFVRKRDGSPDAVSARVNAQRDADTAASSFGSDPAAATAAEAQARLTDVFNFVVWLSAAPNTGTRAVPLRLAYQRGEMSRSIAGTLYSRALRDTLVEGQRLIIVHDSLPATIETSSPLHEPTLQGKRIDTRRMRGFIVGTRLFDPSLQLSRAMFDTAVFTGTETRRLPDGRVLTSGFVFERRRVAELRDTAAHRRMQAISRSTQGPGMLIRPPLGAAPRPNVREPRVVDSLFAIYASTTSSDVRDSILRIEDLLYGLRVRERFAKWNIEHGDTVNALRIINIANSTPLSDWVWDLVRPVLNDPQLAMRMGVNTDEWFSSFADLFVSFPFRTRRDAADWRDMVACPRTVCERIAQEYRRAREPRLRAIGLMAQYRLNPAVYSDTLVEHAARDSVLLRGLSEQARGLTGGLRGDARIPIPSPSAPWRDWFVWMRGATDESIARRDAEFSARRIQIPPRDPTIEYQLSSHGNLLRVAELRWNVDLRDTFRLKYSRSANDTARYVYFTLLQGLGVTLPQTGDMVSQLRSSSVYERMLAQARYPELNFVSADTATLAEIESAILNTLLDSVPSWPLLDNSRRLYTPIRPLGRFTDVHIVADSLRPQSIARLRAKGIEFHQTGWKLPDEASGYVIEIGPIRRSGAFVGIWYSATSLIRMPDGRGGGNETKGRCLLVLVDGQWYLIEALFSVT